MTRVKDGSRRVAVAVHGTCDDLPPAAAADSPPPAAVVPRQATRPGAAPVPAPDGARTAGPDVEIVIPVYNEETDLAPSVRRLHEYLVRNLPFTFLITIADNASTDRTLPVALELAAQFAEVHVLHLAEKGRGRALRAAWSASGARVVAYMDVDLSTDLAALLPLIAPLLSGHSDLAIGTRLARGSRVVRGPKREVISRSYNLLLRAALHARFSDAQCGFKAIRTDAARRLLPLVEDTGWFFDTELLVLAERSGLRIHEVPVDWVDDPDSRVDLVATALADLRGVVRVGRALATGRLPVRELRAQLGRAPLTPELPGVPGRLVHQLVRFAAIGVTSTAAYLLLFVVLRGRLGAPGANLVALLVTAIANTAANRRLTFGVRGVGARSQLEGLVVFGLGLALTTGALGVLHVAAPDVGRGGELAALVAANLAATLLRFVLFRAWVFHPRRHSPRQHSPRQHSPLDDGTGAGAASAPAAGPATATATATGADLPHPAGARPDTPRADHGGAIDPPRFGTLPPTVRPRIPENES
jgi:putative flippase GtrA